MFKLFTWGLVFCNCFVNLLSLVQNCPENLRYDPHHSRHRHQLPPPPDAHPIHNFTNVMTKNERTLLKHYLQNSKVYLEFGGGGSTQMACSLDTIQQIITVEGDGHFLSVLYNTSSCLRNNPKAIPHFVDIGPVKEWSNPVDHRHKALWRNYPEAIHQFQKYHPDLVLVDGRFRVACALATLLALQATIDRVIILVHDFFMRQQAYHTILEYTDIVTCVDQLVVLQAKTPVQIEKITADLNKYFSDYSRR